VKVVFDGDLMWVFSNSSPGAQAFDVTTFELAHQWQIGFPIVNASYAGGRLWVVKENSGSVVELLGDNSYGATLDRGWGASAPIAINGELWIGEKGYVSRYLSGSSAEPSASQFFAGEFPLAFAYDGEYLWSLQDLGTGNATLVQIDPVNRSIVREVTTSCGLPRDIQFDGRYLLISCGAAKSVVRIDPFAPETEQTMIFVGSSPRGLSFDGVQVWVVLEADGVVRKMRVS
jgi:hypothetical protein